MRIALPGLVQAQSEARNDEVKSRLKKTTSGFFFFWLFLKF